MMPYPVWCPHVGVIGCDIPHMAKRPACVHIGLGDVWRLVCQGSVPPFQGVVYAVRWRSFRSAEFVNDGPHGETRCQSFAGLAGFGPTGRTAAFVGVGWVRFHGGEIEGLRGVNVPAR